MAYPTRGEIQAFSMTYGAPVEYVYAWAAKEKSLPDRPDIMGNWAAALGNKVRSWGLDPAYGYAFVEGNGSEPSAAHILVGWLASKGLWSNGAVVARPQAGLYYLGDATTLPAATAPAGVDPFGQVRTLWAGPTTNKLLLIGGAYLGYKMLFGRGRLF